MFRLIEIVKEKNKENDSHAIYPFSDFVTAQGEYETKVGADMKSDLYSAALIMLLDDKGKVTVDHDGNTMLKKIGNGTLSPRVIEVKSTSEEEANISKYETDMLALGNLHSKLGAAIKDNSVNAIMLKAIDGIGSQLEYTYWTRPIEPVESAPEPEEVTE